MDICLRRKRGTAIGAEVGCLLILRFILFHLDALLFTFAATILGFNLMAFDDGDQPLQLKEVK